MLETYPDHVKLVVKNYPLTNNEFSRKAARAALAAKNQGKFWDFHRKLLENHNRMNDEIIRDIAHELKLDMKRFDSDCEDPAIDALIERDKKEGRHVGVRSTPTIFINGKLLKGGSLTEAIDRELKRSAKGT